MRGMRRTTVLALVLSLLALAGCGDGSGGDGAGGTATGTPAASHAPLHVEGPTLVAVGDIACAPGEPRTDTTCHHADTAALAARLDPDAVAALGDLQYPAGALADFDGSFAPTWGRLKDRMRPAVGNHEYETPGAAGYFAYFGRGVGSAGRGWYAYDLGSWHVVVLDTTCAVAGCAAGSPQLRWLRADLAAHPRRCTLAYGHHPRFSSGLHGSNPALAPLWRTLQHGGVDVYLAGHDHDYERFAPQDADGRRDDAHGIVQFVVGTGGKSRYPLPFTQPHSRARASRYGVLQLTLGEGAYRWRFAGEAGERFRDAGAARCR